MKLGIAGGGFVGNALKEGFGDHFEVLTYDKDPNRSEVAGLGVLVTLCEGPIFVCVPTPMMPTGYCDLNIVREVVENLNDEAGKRGKTVVVVIKSTVPPGTCDWLNKRFLSVRCVFNPEFLVERTAVEDFKNQDRIILGGDDEDAVKLVRHVYMQAFPNTPVLKTSARNAEFVKYFINCFLSVKVAFCNEMWQMCQKMGADYDHVTELVATDKRIGTSHLNVPGPDGHLGFGGKCFCKDLNAMMSEARSLGVDPKVMRGAWEKNLEVRPEKDWEKIPGVLSKVRYMFVEEE